MKLNEYYRNMGKAARYLTVLVTVLTALSTISGILWNLYEFANATRQKARTEQIAQLTTYESFGEVLTEYRGIQVLTNKFVNEFNTETLPMLEEKYKDGSSLYFSDELKNYRKIREFYEELGVLIRFGAIDFELAYQLIAFPDDFLSMTKNLQEYIEMNWFSEDSGLKDRKLVDFNANFCELGKRYQQRRQEGNF